MTANKRKDNMNREVVPVYGHGAVIITALPNGLRVEWPGARGVNLHPDEVAALIQALSDASEGGYRVAPPDIFTTQMLCSSLKVLEDRVARLELDAEAGERERALDEMFGQPEDWTELDQPDDYEEAIVSFINLQTPVVFAYQKPEDLAPQARLISPWEIEDGAAPDHRVVRGYDHDRDEVRQFRLDRISGRLEPAAAIYVSPEAYAVEEQEDELGRPRLGG